MKYRLKLLATTIISLILLSSIAYEYQCRSSHKSEQLNGKIVYFYPEGFNCSINLKDDVAIPKQKLHLYFMGTDSNFSLEKWDDESYIIHTVPEILKPDYIIGVSKNANNGEKIILKSSSHAKHPNNRWMLIKNSNDTYRIQNLHTRLYMSIKNRENDQDKNTIIQSNQPLNWEIVCYDDDYSIPWMANIPDNKLLSEINIPGTHDTGTRFVDGLPEQVSLCQCQYLSPREQLNCGIRMFDLRCNVRDYPDDPLLTHTFPCYDGISDTMHLSEVINTTVEFLKRNPSETVIFLVSLGSDISTQGSPEQLENIISKYIYKDIIWGGNSIPTLKDIRGKIVLMRRFKVTGDNLFKIPKNKFGLDMTAWESGSAYSKSKRAVKLKKGCNAWIQDNFNCTASKKIDYFKGALLQASDFSSIPSYDLVFNYSSCTKNNPFTAAKHMNKYILSNNLLKRGKRYGIIPIDYASYPLVRYIYTTNF